MKQQLKLTSLAVGLLSAFMSPALLAEDGQSTSPQAQKTMLALAAKTEALEKQLAELQQQIAQMKKEQQGQNKQVSQTNTPNTNTAPKSVSGTSASTETVVPQQYTGASPGAFSGHLESPVSIHSIPRGEDETGLRSRYYPTALKSDGKILTYLAGVPVVTSPYLGQRPAFDGSDLIVNISKINEDIRLMEQRNLIEQTYVDEGYPMPDTPILMLSGTIQPLFTYQKPYEGSAGGNFTLDTAKIDTTAIINPWVEGLMSFAYSSEPPALGGDVSSNSNVSVDKAFVNIGNLDESPYYMTAGQVYVPFGQYSSNMVSAPLTSVLGQTQVRAAMFGFAPVEDSGFFGTVFGYNSDTVLDNSGAGGANLVYQYGNEHLNGNFGASYITNIADSNGMQDTGAGYGQFAGFGFSSNTEMVSQVPGYDLHGLFNVGPYSFLGEYVSAVEAFDESALSYNGLGAKPQAFTAEGARTFRLFHKPASLALGYGWTDQSVALLQPKQRISTTLNISWWRDTVESLEYRHDIDYASSEYGSGIGATENTVGTGSSADTISALLAVYF